MNFRWRSFSRALHRDLGFLFFGLTIVYAVSGLALNHRHHWNPSYDIHNETRVIEAVPEGSLNRAEAEAFLLQHGLSKGFKKHFEPDRRSIKFFVGDGSVILHRERAELEIELITKRPVLHLFNRLHYNPGLGWTWFADIYAVALIILAITGVIIVRGKYGITRRGGIWMVVGIVVPAVFVLAAL